MRVAVRLTPKAASDRVIGVTADEAGMPVLRAQVTAAPEDGRANAALVALLAKRWRLPKSSLAVAQGAASRRKVIHVTGDPAALLGRITEAMKTDA